MVFKEVGNELPEVWNPENEGDQIEGIYIKKKENVGENKSNLYILDVDGTHKSIWGSTVLDDKMDYVSVGDKIRITYQGKEKNYKKYLVEKDEPETTENKEQLVMPLQAQ